MEDTTCVCVCIYIYTYIYIYIYISYSPLFHEDPLILVTHPFSNSTLTLYHSFIG